MLRTLTDEADRPGVGRRIQLIFANAARIEGEGYSTPEDRDRRHGRARGPVQDGTTDMSELAAYY